MNSSRSNNDAVSTANAVRSMDGIQQGFDFANLPSRNERTTPMVGQGNFWERNTPPRYLTKDEKLDLAENQTPFLITNVSYREAVENWQPGDVEGAAQWVVTIQFSDGIKNRLSFAGTSGRTEFMENLRTAVNDERETVFAVLNTFQTRYGQIGFGFGPADSFDRDGSEADVSSLRDEDIPY